MMRTLTGRGCAEAIRWRMTFPSFHSMSTVYPPRARSPVTFPAGLTQKERKEAERGGKRLKYGALLGF